MTVNLIIDYGLLLVAKQWGYINVDTTKPLPITFTTAFSGISSFYTSIFQTQAVSTYLTNTTIRIVANYGGNTAQGYFLAVGQ